jgi:hypothetical protein
MTFRRDLIKELYYHKKASANVISYVIWTGVSGVAFLYSLFTLPDLFFIIVSGMHFVACAVILFLGIALKNNY